MRGVIRLQIVRQGADITKRHCPVIQQVPYRIGIGGGRGFCRRAFAAPYIYAFAHSERHAQTCGNGVAEVCALCRVLTEKHAEQPAFFGKLTPAAENIKRRYRFRAHHGAYLGHIHSHCYYTAFAYLCGGGRRLLPYRLTGMNRGVHGVGIVLGL